MSRVHVESERVINASPEVVYEVLTDYKDKRPQMLTTNFQDYIVEKGGHGAGTIVRYRLHAARRERPYRMNVDETVKGQVLTERDANSSLVTTWKLWPLNEGKQTKVSVATEWEGSAGMGGFFERTFAPLGLRRIYASMLALLTLLVPASDMSDSGSAVLEEERESNVFAGVGLLVLLLGLVIALVLGINALRKALSKEND